MERLIESVIKYKKITFFIAVIIAVGGVYGYINLPKQEAPDFKVPYGVVTAIYPGAAPRDVEKLVTKKLENEISSIVGYKSCNSISGNSFATVIVELDFDADPEKAWSELRRKMQDLQPELPNECNTISVNTNITDTAGMIISLTGENFTYDELEFYGEKIIMKLSTLEGVQNFEIFGNMSKQITVEIDEYKFRALSLSYSDIQKMIQSQNIEIPSGKISEGNSKININTDGSFESLEDIGNIILGVSSDSGTVIRLKDISEIYYELDDSSYKVLHNGQNSILLTGYFKPNQNILISGKNVETKIEEIKKDLPDGLLFEKVLYQPTDVENAMNGFNENLISGIILVIVVVFVGMGIRNAIIVSVAIPLSIFITFLLMPIFGVKIHQVSIAALIVSLGMLVDNAIVISDSIQVHIDEGMDKLQSCKKGVKEVYIPVLTSTLTTIAAYTPFLFLNSVAGDYVKAIPQIVIMSLSASYIIALFITPVLAYAFFKPKIRKSKKESNIKIVFKNTLSYGLKNRLIVITILIVCLVVSGIQAAKLDLIFFPKADKDIMYIDFTAEKNIDISHTENIVVKILEILKKQPEVIYYTATIGSGMPRFYDTLSVYTQSPDTSQILFKVNLDNSQKYKTNTEFVEYLQNEIKSNVTGGKAVVKELAYAFPIEAPIGIVLKGDDLDRLINMGDKLCEEIEKIDGTYNVFDNYNNLSYEYTLEIDKDRASYFGLTKYDVQNEISIAIRGREASVFRNNQDEQNIIVKSNIKTVKDIENIKIKSSITGNKVPLREIAELKLQQTVPNIKKNDKEFSIDLNSFVHKGYNRQNIVEEIKEIISYENMQGIEVMYEGEDSFIKDNFKDIGYLAVIALVVVYLILLFQFKSFFQPFIILVTVPLSVIGVVWGLYIFKQPISFTALLGIVSLFGIVVNNAIVLLDYINVEIKSGKCIETACVEASGRRFRPIMLSTITTVIGLTPLAIGKGELFKPMAIVLMSGLIISTLLTLIIIPVISSQMIKSDKQ